jgi:hypothetical protein
MLISLTIPMIIPTTSRREVTFSFIQTHETNLTCTPKWVGLSETWVPPISVDMVNFPN